MDKIDIIKKGILENATRSEAHIAREMFSELYSRYEENRKALLKIGSIMLNIKTIKDLCIPNLVEAPHIEVQQYILDKEHLENGIFNYSVKRINKLLDPNFIHFEHSDKVEPDPDMNLNDWLKETNANEFAKKFYIKQGIKIMKGSKTGLEEVNKMTPEECIEIVLEKIFNHESRIKALYKLNEKLRKKESISFNNSN